MAATTKKTATAKVGRPATGKRSNAEYRQTSLWLRRDTLDHTLRALVSDGERIELSVLVQNLLERWIAAGARIPKGPNV